jgi:beta-lactam-binding protein with PASTA domain
LRNIIILIAIFIAAFFTVTLITFLLIRKGPPEVAVPKVTNKDLIEGLIILQKKNLRVIIDPRYFSDQPKNMIVEQIPKAGSIVREQKDIKLIVSKGPIISIVEDYTGMTIPFVQNRLQEIFSFQGKTIKIGNVTYVSSEYPEGTIVGQYPSPNTPITNVDTIDLIVSKGKEIHIFKLKDYTGQKVDEVMQLLALRGVLVRVVTEEVLDPAMNGIIISQDQPEGTVVKRNDTVSFNVGYLPSEEGKAKLYARVLNFDVPPDIEEAAIRIVVKDKIGEREIYNAQNVGGDNISVPFKSYSNTTVFIYVDDGLFEMRKLE